MNSLHPFIFKAFVFFVNRWAILTMLFIGHVVNAAEATSRHNSEPESVSTSSSDKNMLLCYFSLNSDKEFAVMKKWSVAHNKNLRGQKIEVQEYMGTENSAEENFIKMIEEHLAKGIQCDGLVISGHHTGSFGGKRGNGLSVDLLEKLSCNPKYAPWFEKVNALWLQGCRTLGARIVNSNEQATNADFHAGRVFGVREEDHLNVNYSELSQQFTDTLDQSNPLSSRYMRTFQNATVYGWTGSAPGERAQSEMSLPFFIANMAKLRKESAPLKLAPLSECAPCYTDALVDVLKKNQKSPTDQLKIQNEGIEAWLRHGSLKKVPKLNGKNPSSFENSDINACPAMCSTDPHQRKLFERAQILNCSMKNNKSNSDPVEAAKLLATHSELTPMVMNTLTSYLKNDSTLDAKSKEKVREHLRNNPKFIEYLHSRIRSSEVGILRKIDYLQVLEDVQGAQNLQARGNVHQAALKIVSEKSPQPVGSRASLDHQNTINEIFRSLNEMKMLDGALLKPILDDPKGKNLSRQLQYLGRKKHTLPLWNYAFDHMSEEFKKEALEDIFLGYNWVSEKGEKDVLTYEDTLKIMNHKAIHPDWKLRFELDYLLRGDSSKQEVLSAVALVKKPNLRLDLKSYYAERLLDHKVLNEDERRAALVDLIEETTFKVKAAHLLSQPSASEVIASKVTESKDVTSLVSDVSTILANCKAPHCDPRFVWSEATGKLKNSGKKENIPSYWMHHLKTQHLVELLSTFNQQEFLDALDVLSNRSNEEGSEVEAFAEKIQSSVFNEYKKTPDRIELLLQKMPKFSVSLSKDLMKALDSLVKKNDPKRMFWIQRFLNKESHAQLWPHFEKWIDGMEAQKYNLNSGNLYEVDFKNLKNHLDKVDSESGTYSKLIWKLGSKMENQEKEIDFYGRLYTSGAAPAQFLEKIVATKKFKTSEILSFVEGPFIWGNEKEFFSLADNYVKAAKVLPEDANFGILKVMRGMEWRLSRDETRAAFGTQLLSPEADAFFSENIRKELKGKDFSMSEKTEIKKHISNFRLSEASVKSLLEHPALAEQPYLTNEIISRYFNEQR